MSWKPETYKASKIDEMIRNKIITTPIYQRGSKWSEEQRSFLIDSIKRGFPFGSILLNKKVSANNQVTYDLIDGLQRCTTINKFLNNPGKYFKEEDIEDDYVDKIYDLMDENDKGTDKSATEKSIKDFIVKYVQDNLPTMEKVKSIQYYNVSTSLKSSWPSLKDHIDELNGIIEKLFEKFKKTCTDLNDADIPAIVYDGDQSLLPEVFERINSKGTALSKYDIYHATWRDDEFDINENYFNSFYDDICKRYEEMNDSDVRVSDFDATDYKAKKKITTFDLCYALGKRLKRDYPNLFGKNKDISVDSIGFNLINSALGKPANKLAELKVNLEPFKYNIQEFLRDILESCKTVDEYLKVITTLKGNSTKDVAILHSENQIISIVVSVFLARFATVNLDASGKIDHIQLTGGENADWSGKKETFKKNIQIIYVQDSLSSVWSGTGDKKLYNIICDASYYLRTQPVVNFENVFNSWFDRICSERNEEKCIKSPTTTDKIVLNIYTSQTVTAKDAHSGETWDIEHICPKKEMKDILARFNASLPEDKHLKLPISSIGNICYLPSKLNRSKEQKTIYEAGMNPSDLAEVESKFTLTNKTDLDFLSDKSLTMDQFQNVYMAFIKNRSQTILEKLKQYLF